MQITVRAYRKSDYLSLIDTMERLQDYLVTIDPLKLCHRPPEYGRFYTTGFLKQVENSLGKIFIAVCEKQFVGCVGGVIEKQTKADFLERIPAKVGRVLELFVYPEFRAIGAGKVLMEKMENYLVKQGCTIIRLEVFEPNHLARDFYIKLGYSDRTVDMIKVLKNNRTHPKLIK